MKVQVKVFEATMHAGFATVEAKVNEFLSELDPSSVISVTPNMCTVGTLSDREHENDFYQAFAITVVYRTAPEALGDQIEDRDRVIRCIEKRGGKASRQEILQALKNSIAPLSLGGILEKMTEDGDVTVRTIPNARGKPTLEYELVGKTSD